MEKIIKRHLIFISCLLMLGSCSDAKNVEWHMINVNYHSQGDAHLIIDGNINVMIDAGEKYAADFALVPYLKSKQIKYINHFFISHPHTDHYAGIESILDADIKIKNIYFNLPPEGVEDWNYKRSDFLSLMNKAKNLGSKVKDINKNFTLRLPSSTIKILYAHKEKTFFNGRRVSVNDYSLIMQWDAGEFRTLFTGDLNAPLGNELAKHKHFKADILKVPHHGVTAIAPNSFFETVNPSLNMFPSTRTLWNHPRGQRVKGWTLNSDIYYCNNGLNGNVILSIQNDSITGEIEQETNKCPNGIMNIVPGQKIDEVNQNSLNLSPAINILLSE